MSDTLARVGRSLGSLARRDHPFGAATTYRVGGSTALFVEPDDEDQLRTVAKAIYGVEIPIVVLGRGSNILVADRGFAGLVVSIGPGFDHVDVRGTVVRAGAGAALPVLARRTVAAGLHGLEWAVGVPGSVGGAIRMNAGGHGSDTAATLTHYRWADLRTGIVTESPARCLRSSYRHSELESTDVVIEGVHELVPGDVDEGNALIADIVRWRRANQPGGSNAGSVFVNPDGDSAGRLIDATGLKGFRIGSAEVSTKHANFIQADEGGSADDVYQLIEHVRAAVCSATGVVLRTELRLIGYDEPGEVDR